MLSPPCTASRLVQPLSVAVLASILFGEVLGPSALLGLLLGVLGLLLVEVPQPALESVRGRYLESLLGCWAVVWRHCGILAHVTQLGARLGLIVCT